MRWAQLNRSATFVACTLLLTAAPHALYAQGIEQSAPEERGEEADQQGGEATNEYGWPTDYVAQVGAGVTDAVTNGFSEPEEDESEEDEGGVPPPPSADLCSDWEGTEVHEFCMEKTVPQQASERREQDG